LLGLRLKICIGFECLLVNYVYRSTWERTARISLCSVWRGLTSDSSYCSTYQFCSTRPSALAPGPHRPMCLPSLARRRDVSATVDWRGKSVTGRRLLEFILSDLCYTVYWKLTKSRKHHRDTFGSVIEILSCDAAAVFEFWKQNYVK